MKKLNRREWITGSVVAAAGAAAAAIRPGRAWSRPLGANNNIRLAIVGLRTRGGQLVDAFRQLPDARITALCDCDAQFFDKELSKFQDGRQKPRTVVDFRRLLDAKDIDAVVVATPNHWHALMTVWACQAGKDVYVEKPVSHDIREGRRMVEAARKHRRIVQSGTQNRSDTGLAAAIEFLRKGGLGKPRLARAFSFPNRQPIGKVTGPQQPPKTCDYNLFQGPAPLVPLRRQRLHYDWHFVWATGNGDCGNRGVHTFDHIRWITGQDKLPGRVITIGGRMVWDDDGQTPNAQITLLDGKPAPILFELTNLPRGKNPESRLGHPKARGSMLLEYEGGYLVGGRGGATAYDRDDKLIEHFKGDAGRTHQANFLAAMRSRKHTDLKADVLEGHVSSAMCHMANVSHLVGERRTPAEIAAAIQDNKVLAESFDRLVNQLKANGADLDKDRLTLGATLTMDAETERFTGEHSRRANVLLRRDGRRPFAMPEEV